MVLFHYALVDDLISQEEFERRVEAKIEECGDLLDEPTAAMLVVGALGRQHVCCPHCDMGIRDVRLL